MADMLIVSPTLADGVVYAGCYDDFVYALDADTGELLWRFETENDQNLPPDVALVNPPPTVADGILYVVRAGGELFALDAYTGERLWNDEPVYADSLLSDGIRYMPDLDFDASNLNVRAIDESSGELRWETEVALSSELPLLFPLTATGGNVYVSDDYQVHALDSTTGKLAWSFDAEDVVQDPPRDRTEWCTSGPTRQPTPWTNRLGSSCGDTTQRLAALGTVCPSSWTTCGLWWTAALTCRASTEPRDSRSGPMMPTM